MTLLSGANKPNFYALSEETVIRVADMLKYLPFLDTRMEFIFEATGYSGFFGTEIREIDGETYTWGLCDENGMFRYLESEVVQKVGQFITTKEKEIVYWGLMQEFQARFDKCTTLKEQIILIQEELKHIEESQAYFGSLNDSDEPKIWHKGYIAESRKIDISFRAILSDRAYHLIALGASIYKKKCKLEEQLEILQAGGGHTSKEDEGESPTIVSMGDKASHRVLLLHELGIIEHLERRYPEHNKYQIADIVSAFLGIEDLSKAGTIRKAIGNIHLPRGHEKGIKTEPAIEKVEKALLKLGITPTKL